MALNIKKYIWSGLTLTPYVKISQRTIRDFLRERIEEVKGEDVTFYDKEYVCDYVVSIYGTKEKEGILQQLQYSFPCTESCTLEDAYSHLKTVPEFSKCLDV